MGTHGGVVDQPLSGNRQTLPPLVAQSVHVLACPACGATLQHEAEALICSDCDRRYACVDGIPQLFWPHEVVESQADVTRVVQAFYEANPFPDYDAFDSPASFKEKAEQGVFAKLLDEQVAPTAMILDVGCGTGQLSNFLALAPMRRVFGVDLCMNSLRLGAGFAQRYHVENVAFCQMNLFRLAFKPKQFDLVVCQGVLHHTSRPYEGFRRLVTLVKPGGWILIGLYNTFGRIPTQLRRMGLGPRGVYRMDRRLRSGTLAQHRASRWFMDQYRHPHESVHSFGEVLRWFQRTGVEFVSSIPHMTAWTPFRSDEQLFAPRPAGNRVHRALVQLHMLVRGGREGGLFMMIGRRSDRQCES